MNKSRKTELDVENEWHHFPVLREKDEMVEITQNEQKSIIFIVFHKQRRQLKVLSTTYGRKL